MSDDAPESPPDGNGGRRRRRRRRENGPDSVRPPDASPAVRQPDKKPEPRKQDAPREIRSRVDRIKPQPAQPKPAETKPPQLDDHDDAPSEPAVQWGRDDDAPTESVALAADLPTEPDRDDHDPVTTHIESEPLTSLGDDIASVVGVRVVHAGRVQWFDAGEADYEVGDRIIVDSDRGQRLGWIAVAPTRKPVRDRGLRRVMRRANDNDLRGEHESDADRVRMLRLAKDAANKVVDRDQRPLMKVYRVEQQGRGKLLVYYTSDERLDLREFLRELGAATNARIELRQLGVRDEAKAVGGIGSCGLTLCCTTWLPDFVPVSIKMAKDQGLVLSPTKVSGQCGRLKCCLVYEQAGYAELRKGLPKLGKRVISARGDGRVVEVDVLRQRVRVSYGPGETEVLPAAEVRPMFPSGNQPANKSDETDEADASDEPGDA